MQAKHFRNINLYLHPVEVIQSKQGYGLPFLSQSNALKVSILKNNIQLIEWPVCQNLLIYQK